MSKKKIIVVALGILLVAGVAIYLNFADITKSITERVATKAMGVDVKISSLSVNFQDKEVTVTGLKIANPKGYKKSHIMTVDTIKVALSNVSRDPIDFKDIDVMGAVVNLEVTEKGSNVSELKKMLASKSANSKPAAQPVRVIVRDLMIGKSQLNPSVTMLGGDLKAANVPAVHLTGIGVKNNGVLAREAIAQILTKYFSAVQNAAGNAGFLDGAGALEKVMEKPREEIKKLGEGLGGLFE